MLFNSLEFLLFLPTVTVVYFCLPRRLRPAFLLLASFSFYWFFSVPLSLLLVWSTVLDYSAARAIERASRPWQRKAALAVSVIGNLGTLAAFKYVDFFGDSLAVLLGFQPWPSLNLILPMGISFYTFQTMSYTIDVYRGDCAARKSIMDVALYVSFFPQLVAGPIMRGTALFPQFEEDHQPNLDRIASGALLCCWGLLKKVYIADPMGVLANSVYGSVDHPVAAEGLSGLTLLMGTYAFAIQIYCDFSAYSDIAIGSARILGIRLMQNFNAPYLAGSLREFWHRWHISLSTWLRDYLYIPLGGSKGPQWRTCVNLMATMLLGGLWHGANWTFVVWGALHGGYLVAGRLMSRGAAGRRSEPGRLRRCVNVFVTFHLVCLAWVFFRADTVTQAWTISYRILTWAGGETTAPVPLLCLVALLAFQWVQERGSRLERFANFSPVTRRWAIYTAMLLIMMALAGAPSAEFIYFQF